MAIQTTLKTIRLALYACSPAFPTPILRRTITAALLVLLDVPVCWWSLMLYWHWCSHVDNAAIMLSIVAVPSSQSANGIILRSSFPCLAMASDILCDGTINRTMCFPMEVHRNAFHESVVAQIEAMGRTSATKPPVSVRLVQNQVQVQEEWSLWWRAEWNDSYKRPRTSASQSPNSAVAVLSLGLHLSLSFTAHFPAALPLTNPNICHLYLCHWSLRTRIHIQESIWPSQLSLSASFLSTPGRSSTAPTPSSPHLTHTRQHAFNLLCCVLPHTPQPAARHRAMEGLARGCS